MFHHIAIKIFNSILAIIQLIDDLIIDKEPFVAMNSRDRYKIIGPREFSHFIINLAIVFTR